MLRVFHFFEVHPPSYLYVYILVVYPRNATGWNIHTNVQKCLLESIYGKQWCREQMKCKPKNIRLAQSKKYIYIWSSELDNGFTVKRARLICNMRMKGHSEQKATYHMDGGSWRNGGSTRIYFYSNRVFGLTHTILLVWNHGFESCMEVTRQKDVAKDL